ncbi:MAG: hypothetical protein GY733_08040, partial [bacterium]|nr:hypothetical protein [bacterium]
MSSSQVIDLREEVATGEPVGPEEGVDGVRGPEKMPGILRLAWPAVLGNLLMSLVGIVGIKIVGSLGAQAVAAVTTGHRIFFIAQGVMMALSAGTTAMVARAWGAGDREEAGRVTRASVIISALLAVALAIPCIVFAEQMVGVFQLDSETLAQAADFLRLVSIFNLGFAIVMVLGSAMRAAGDTITPLWIGAATNVVNVFLVYGMVYGRFG